MKRYSVWAVLVVSLCLCSVTFAQTAVVNTSGSTDNISSAKDQKGVTGNAGSSSSSVKSLSGENSAKIAADDQSSTTKNDSESSEESKKLSDEKDSKTSTATAALAAGESPANQIPSLNSISVSVQPFTGSASVPIPISVPQGRAGIQPSVALVYSSSLPESFTGVGWNLDLGSIQRSTKKGPPKYNSTDSYVLMQSGSSSNLVYDSSLFYYRQEIEGAFAKIESSGSGASVTWTMTDKKGTKYFFGQTAASQQVDPADPVKIFEWALDRVEDLNGNYMTITYIKHGNRLYPDTIQYTGETSPAIAPFAKVVFTYTDAARTLQSYRTSFLVSSSKLLENIAVYGNNVLMSRYRFAYQQSVNSKRYLLTSVQQYGANDTSTLPAVTFTYQGDVKGFTTETDWSIPANAAFVYHESGGKWTDRGVRIADVNGDAYPDLVRSVRACGDTYTVSETYLNTKNEGFQLTTGSAWNVPDSAQGFLRSCNEIDRPLGLQLLDVDGDQWTDLIRNYRLDGTLINQSFLNDEISAFSQTAAWAPPTGTQIYDGWTDGDTLNILNFYRGVLYSDVNGDGFVDIVISSDDNGSVGVNHNVYINQGANGGTGWVQDPMWTTPTSVYPNGVRDFRQGATLVDLNGDGLPDLASFNSPTAIAVAMNNGHGWTQTSTPWDSLPMSVPFNTGAVQLADVNGDGLTDIMIGDGGDMQVIINTGSGWFDDSHAWWSASGYFKRLDQHLLDANADGVVDYMYSITGVGVTPTTEVHLNVSKPADLLVKIENGIGGATEITYDSSAHYNNTFLPFIVQVVKSVKVSTSTESYTTNYSYANGLWAADGREFRGFGAVTVTDPEGNYATTNYLQDKIYKGMVSQQASYDAAGNLFNKTVNTWDKKILIAGDVSVFPYLKRVDQYVYDGNATGERSAQEFFYAESPQYGNLTKTIQYGEVDLANGSDNPSNDKRTVETTYLNSTSPYILGLPTQITTKDHLGNQMRQTSFYYDNHTNLTDAPTKGQLTKRVRWGGTGLPTPTDLYSYDSSGNLLTTTDPMNNMTLISYDPLKVFPLTTTNALGHVVTNEYYGINGIPLSDANGFAGLWGQQRAVTDANNQKSKRVYDTFGRLVKSISPLDTVTYPSTTIDYVIGGSWYSYVTTHVRRTAGQAPTIDTVQYFDGLGRLIQTKTETISATQFIVSDQTQYNSRGLPEYKYFPRFTSNNMGIIDPIITSEPRVKAEYDALGRTIKTTNPDGTYSNTVYSDWSVAQYDERGAKKEFAYDAYGRVWRVREFTGYDGRSSLYPAVAYSVYAATNYSYSKEGDLTQVTDTGGNTTSIGYDKLGRKVSMTDPDMGAWSYTYDLNGNLLTQTDAKSQTITFTYDALNRLKTKTSGTALNVTYTYDDTANSGFAKGRLSKVDYTGGSTRFVYDLMGRETQSTKTIDGSPYIVSRVYDNLSNVTQITYPDASNVFYQYNSVGQLQAISNNASVLPPLVLNNDPRSTIYETMLAKIKDSASKLYTSWVEPKVLGVKEAEAAAPNTLFVSNITYNANGQVLVVTYGNGITTTNEYFPLTFRLKRIYTVKAPSTVLQDLNYTYDPIGNITAINDVKNTEDQTFTYDALNRLKTAVNSNAAPNGYGTLNFSYSPIGNLTSKEGRTFTYSGVNAGPHAVTSLSDGTTFTYDLNGNRATVAKAGVTTNYTYDVENRLIDVTKAGSTLGQYFYDGDGGRTAKISYTTGLTGNNTCFLAGTNILMADGSQKPIEDIKVGDLVASFDEKSLTKKSAKVTELFNKENTDEYLLINDSLKVTPNHVVYSQGEWKEIGKMKEGDVLLDSSLQEIKLDKITKVEAQNSVPVYNLEVEGDHNYYANGILVHNKLAYNPPAVVGVPVTSGVITHYVGSLYETTKGVGVDNIYLGSTQIATISNNQVRFYFQDHLGSTNVVTDSAGASIELIEYKPFGEFARHEKYGGNENVAWYYFTGKPVDDETGLMYFGGRYYSSGYGKFLTPDTVVQAPYNPQTLNRYSYCGNNPVNHIDPTGHSFWKSFISAFIGAVAAVLTAGISVGFSVLATQGLSALSAGTLALSGAIGGAVSGGVGASLNGAGWQGILQGAAIGGVLGGIGGFAAGGGFGNASAWVAGGLFAGGVANAAINNSWADFAGSFLGGVTGTAVGMGAVKLSVGTSKTEGANAGQQAAESNPQDVQGAIDAGRSSGGESGAIDAAQAVSNVKIDVREAVHDLMLGGAVDASGEVKVRVPWSPRGSVVNSVGRAGVFRGGPKSIVMRGINSLGVAAQNFGKALGTLDALKYTKSAYTAFQNRDYLTFSHDFGMAGLSTFGVVVPGAGKFAPYLGTIVDYSTKPVY